MTVRRRTIYFDGTGVGHEEVRRDLSANIREQFTENELELFDLPEVGQDDHQETAGREVIVVSPEKCPNTRAQGLAQGGVSQEPCTSTVTSEFGDAHQREG